MNAFVINSIKGGVDGNSKDSKAGLKQINEIRKEVPIFDSD